MSIENQNHYFGDNPMGVNSHGYTGQHKKHKVVYNGHISFYRVHLTLALRSDQICDNDDSTSYRDLRSAPTLRV